MAKIHVLERTGLDTYHVVVHGPAPAGNNAAGVAWSMAIQNSGRAKTTMIEGVNAGQISTAERQAVEAGTTIEGVFMWNDTPTWTNAERLADLDLRATQLLAELTTRYQAELNYFGFTRN